MKKLNKDDYIPPVEGVEDKLHRVIRTVVSMSTLAGIPAEVSAGVLENFNLLWKPPAEARAEKWVNDVIFQLTTLSDKVENLEHSLASEEFQSLLITANQLVIKHHQKDKIKHFANAVTNSITAESLSYDKKFMFLSILDGLTLLHIKVLRLLQDFVIWGSDNEVTEGRFSHYLVREIIKSNPELVKEMQLVHKVINDLENHNFWFVYQLLFKPETKVIRYGVITNTDAGTIDLEIPIEETPDKKYRYASKLNKLGTDFLYFIEERNG